MLVRVKVFKFEIVATFRVPTFAVVAKRFVAYRLFVRTNEFKFEIVATFRVPTFAVVDRRFVATRAFEA